MKNLGIEELKTIIIASLLVVIGILFCCSLTMGISGLSVIIGMILIIIGVLFLLNRFFAGTSLLTPLGLSGSSIIAFGIMFISINLAGIIFTFIPCFLIVLGIIIVTDSLIFKFIKKQENLLDFIIKTIVGGLSLIIGLCLLFIEGFMNYSSIILGVLMIIYGVYIIFIKFTNTQSTQQKN